MSIPTEQEGLKLRLVTFFPHGRRGHGKTHNIRDNRLVTFVLADSFCVVECVLSRPSFSCVVSFLMIQSLRSGMKGGHVPLAGRTYLRQPH